MQSKKLLLIAAIIFISLALFSFAPKASAQSTCTTTADCGPGRCCDALSATCYACTASTCGNGVVDQNSEDCDMNDLQGQTCQDFFGPSGTLYTGGALSCNSNCTFNLNSCTEGSSGTPPAGQLPTAGAPPAGAAANCLGGSIVGGFCVPTNTGLADPQGGIFAIISNFLMWLIAIFGFLALAGFIISGIQYIVAAGDEGVMETAKRNMKYTIIGVIVGLSALVIIQAVTAALNATSPIF